VAPSREGLPERYLKALARLTEGRQGALDERVEQQAERLRARFAVSEPEHAALLAELLGLTPEVEEPAEPPPLELALKLTEEPTGGLTLSCALIHRGDFSFERLEVSLYGVLSGGARRLLIEGLEPDERSVISAPLIAHSGADGDTRWAGAQLQIKATDIADEVSYYRAVAIAWELTAQEAEEVAEPTSGDLSLARAAHPQFERWGFKPEGPLCAQEERSAWEACAGKRLYYSLLGPGDWREVPLFEVKEAPYYVWEVASAQPTDQREGARAHRVGDRLSVNLSELSYHERLCPSGRAWVGAPLGVGNDWETPLHLIELSEQLWCHETPITQALWREVMGQNPSAMIEEEAPVDSVSWWEALLFCNRLSERVGLAPVYDLARDEEGAQRVKRLDLSPDLLTQASDERVHWGYRLPTEAEWEHLARAGQDRPFAGAHYPDEVAWTLESRRQAPAPVAQKKANEWGLYDLCGNVWEWCEDRFEEFIYRRRVRGALNPRQWDEGEASRVRRGGSWATRDEGCRVFSRAQGEPSWRSHFVGLRVVRVERGGPPPQDQAPVTQPSWGDLSSGPVALIGAKGTDRRGWILRLEALGVPVTLDLDEALSVVWVWCPRKTLRNTQLRGLERHPMVRDRSVEASLKSRPRQPTTQVALTLERMRGRGRWTLEEPELLALLLEREHELAPTVEPVIELPSAPEPTPPDPPPKPARLRVGVIGRFALTQSELKRRLRAHSMIPVMVNAHTAIERLDLLVCGGGNEAQRQARRARGLKVKVVSEVEGLQLLESRQKRSET